MTKPRKELLYLTPGLKSSSPGPTCTEMAFQRLHFLGVAPHLLGDMKVFLAKERQPLGPQGLRCCLFASVFPKLSLNSCHGCEPWDLNSTWLQGRRALLKHGSSIPAN